MSINEHIFTLKRVVSGRYVVLLTRSQSHRLGRGLHHWIQLSACDFSLVKVCLGWTGPCHCGGLTQESLVENLGCRVDANHMW